MYQFKLYTRPTADDRVSFYSMSFAINLRFQSNEIYTVFCKINFNKYLHYKLPVLYTVGKKVMSTRLYVINDFWYMAQTCAFLQCNSKPYLCVTITLLGTLNANKVPFLSIFAKDHLSSAYERKMLSQRDSTRLANRSNKTSSHPGIRASVQRSSIINLWACVSKSSIEKACIYMKHYQCNFQMLPGVSTHIHPLHPHKPQQSQYVLTALTSF